MISRRKVDRRYAAPSLVRVSLGLLRRKKVSGRWRYAAPRLVSASLGLLLLPAAAGLSSLGLDEIPAHPRVDEPLVDDRRQPGDRVRG